MILIDNMHVHLMQAWAYGCLFLPFELFGGYVNASVIWQTSLQYEHLYSILFYNWCIASSGIKYSSWTNVIKQSQKKGIILSCLWLKENYFYFVLSGSLINGS